MVNSYMI